MKSVCFDKFAMTTCVCKYMKYLIPMCKDVIYSSNVLDCLIRRHFTQWSLATPFVDKPSS